MPLNLADVMRYLGKQTQQPAGGRVPSSLSPVLSVFLLFFGYLAAEAYTNTSIPTPTIAVSSITQVFQQHQCSDATNTTCWFCFRIPALKVLPNGEVESFLPFLPLKSISGPVQLWELLPAPVDSWSANLLPC